MFIDAVKNQLQNFDQQLASVDSSSESKSDLIKVALKMLQTLFCLKNSIKSIQVNIER